MLTSEKMSKQSKKEKGEGSRLGQANSARKCMRTRLSCLCNLFDSLSCLVRQQNKVNFHGICQRKWPGHCRKYIYIGCRWPRICDSGYTWIRYLWGWANARNRERYYAAWRFQAYLDIGNQPASCWPYRIIISGDVHGRRSQWVLINVKGALRG